MNGTDMFFHVCSSKHLWFNALPGGMLDMSPENNSSKHDVYFLASICVVFRRTYFYAQNGGGINAQVTGIFFESKVDYTTWFGANVEYIHGIQVRRGDSR